MKRYRFLTKNSVYETLNKLRAAFLAAKDGGEVEEIIMGVLTQDERLRIGRRIQIARMLVESLTYEEISEELNVGFTTIKNMDTRLFNHPNCYNLINKRVEKVEKEYKRKAYEEVGGSTKIFKGKSYTGFKRKDVKR